MSQVLTAVHCDGIRVDCLGSYLAGLGLLAALSRRWPNVRGCWRRGHFVLIAESLDTKAVERFLLDEWKPSPYERWWKDAQEADKKTDRAIQAARGREPNIDRVRLLDCHIVGCGTRQSNTLFLNGGSLGRRNLQKVFEEANKLIAKNTRQSRQSWLSSTLFGGHGSLPELRSAGTWFVYANERFNSGQKPSRETGWISPWAFLLALEGARLLRGNAARRLGSRARPYAVFPFLCGAPSPASQGDVKLTRGEFWAPVWGKFANCAELEALLERGLARVDDRAAQAPHEFALAARSAGVDSGIETFVRFSLRQTTSSQVFEAIPGEWVRVAERGETDSELIVPLIGWMKFLPEPAATTQKAKFLGMRGPIERAIIQLAEGPNDAELWRSLLLVLSSVQDRLDRNREFRKLCGPVPQLDMAWFDKAWPVAPPEIVIARSLASIGARTNSPLFVNVFGADQDERRKRTFPASRPNRAVYHAGDPARALAGILERRLADVGPHDVLPLGGSAPCTSDMIEAVLCGSIDLHHVVRWLPAMVLLDWCNFNKPAESAQAVSGVYLLQALFRPFFHCGEIMVSGNPLFSQPPRSATARSLLCLIRSGDWAQAIDVARARYLVEGRRTINPTAQIEADGERVAAALLIPMRSAEVAAAIERWIEPRAIRPEREDSV